MPLTSTGKKILNKMEMPPSQGGYGGKKGKSVFYASINAKKPGSSKWHGKKKMKKRHNVLREMMGYE